MASEPVKPNSMSVLVNKLSQYEKWVEAKIFSTSRSVQEQRPQILWIGCSDSRVLEAEITHSGPGDVFVHRNIANQFHLDDDNAMSVLSYGVETLKVHHIFMVGHTHCGGVAHAHQKAAETPVEPGTAPDDRLAHLTPLERWLAPLTELARNTEGDPTALSEANVRMQVENLRKCEVIQREWETRDVPIHGLVYELETGNLRDLGITVGRYGKLEE
ncbi:hypothetical protein V8D89_003462 [Ganoderma adspersum]